MRIILDLQGLQTPGSRHRGIGRYSMSLAKSVLRQGTHHEFHVLFNSTFNDAVDEIRDELSEWIPQDCFHIFPVAGPADQINPNNVNRRIASEICREALIANLQPDFVHISSLFEGLFDDSVISIGRCGHSCPVSVTLYDLIPLIGREVYLINPDIERWYEDRLLHLRRADLLLAISASSAREAVDFLNFPTERVINIGTDADPQFEPSPSPDNVTKEALRRLGISKPFVMYTGGIDWRKNIEGLLAAYAKLPQSVRKKHQLVVVCSIQPEQKRKLEILSNELGLREKEVLFTGFVSEADLITLYKSCKLFVFPSWHEGFGLPPLEAMRCGAPVIGGNRSSLPEVIGLPEALFDPFNEGDIRDRLEQGLTDSDFRSRLVRHGSQHQMNFSWERTGRAALDAIESFCAKQDATVPLSRSGQARKRLAFVSPILPAASGIADYSAELIPELSRHYDIEIIVKDQEAADNITDTFIKSNLPVRTIDWMKQNFTRYERVLYQVGNSDHHNHMIYSLPDFPGVVVLHDFFLSGVISFEQYHYNVQDIWTSEIYRSHGYPAISYQHRTGDAMAAIMRYPANRSVSTDALGVIVHSEHSKDLARRWLGKNWPDQWHLIPHLRQSVRTIDQVAARERLGFKKDDFIVSSFGYVNPTKQSRRILDAWLNSPLAKQEKAKLNFVGANHFGEYGQEMLNSIEEAAGQNAIRITGWADQSLYRDYLAASDVAVQLRTLSRGETSGTVLDAMNYGLATIVNAHGSMEYLPEEAVLMLPDEFMDEQLTSALTKMTSKSTRKKLVKNAKTWIEQKHDPRNCADAYHEAIEACYTNARVNLSIVTEKLRDLKPEEWSPEDIHNVSVAAEIATDCAPPTSYIDVTDELSEDFTKFVRIEFQKFISDIFANDLPRRLEPVFYDSAAKAWRYARVATLNAIGMTVDSLRNDPAIFAPSSDLLKLNPGRTIDGDAPKSPKHYPFVNRWVLTAAKAGRPVRDSDHVLAAIFQSVGFAMHHESKVEI